MDGDTDRERQGGKTQHVKERQRNTPGRQRQEAMLWALGWLSGTKATPNAAFPALKDLEPGTALHLSKQKQLLKFPRRDENEVQTSLLSSAPTHGHPFPCHHPAIPVPPLLQAWPWKTAGRLLEPAGGDTFLFLAGTFRNTLIGVCVYLHSLRWCAMKQASPPEMTGMWCVKEKEEGPYFKKGTCVHVCMVSMCQHVCEHTPATCQTWTVISNRQLTFRISWKCF